MRVAAGLLLLGMLLAGCASRPPIAAETPAGSSAGSAAVSRHEPSSNASAISSAGPPPDQPLLRGDRDLIVMTAFAQVGKPYRYGGNGPEAFDCSGLVRYAYGAGGAKTPRTTATLFRSGQAISFEAARPGDLFFYRLDPKRSAPSHVVVYLGDGEGIHAPSTGGQIRAVRLGIPYFSQRFVGARRLLE